MTNFSKAHAGIIELAKIFQDQYHYFMDKYSEAEVRKDFIDKFFTALGWDVDHNFQHNPYTQEVKVEKSQRQSHAKSQKRADYAFFLRPDYKNPKFFVEAKKPSRNLKNADDYFQTIRYGWNAGTGISILTDFEELHIIDCRYKPDIDQVFTGQHKVFNYQDYLDAEKFSDIFWLLSYEAVADGNIEKYVDALPKPRGGARQAKLFKGGYMSIDNSFLEYLDDIREKLAKAFKQHDENLDSEILTEVVQRTVDRLVFMRFLEDKLIEPENHVSEFGKRNTAWRDFITTCMKMQAKYNGLVFQTHPFDNQNLSETSDKMFSQVCENFSHLNTPYDFNVIPIHILGSIYERFLGKIVVATGKRVRIEEKLEVRKAGGVYYTPKYIVDYIVKGTVGKLIEGKTPKEIAKLKFIDIACGSGTFLIGALETLFEYHIQFYNNYPEEARKDKCHQIDGAFALTIKQKSNILKNNIFGIDIDHQAAEVTQLSLYLKMLEDETTATANEMMVLFHEKILPDLSTNIKCGNSLVDMDILRTQLFDFKEERLLNPFNFDSSFPDIIRRGGFDGIIGNPPYRTLLLGKKQFAEPEYLIQYLTVNYPYSSTYKLNLFSLFIEKSKHLLNKNGVFAYIIPSAINQAHQFRPLRKFILDNFNIDIIYDLRYKVFNEAEIGGNTIFVFTKSKKKDQFSLLTAKNEKEFGIPQISDIYFADVEKDIDYSFVIEKSAKTLLDKISANNSVPLDQVARIYQGIITGDNKKFLSNTPKDDKWKKILRGKDVHRYALQFNNNYVLYSPEELWSNTDPKMFNVPKKIISRQTSDKLIASIDEEGYFTLDSTHVIHLKTDSIALEYLLGIYNSKLFNYLYQSRVKESGRVFAQVKTVNLKPLPIKLVDKKKSQDIEDHDMMVLLVKQLLDAKRQFNASTSLKDQEYLTRKFISLDHQIDQLVYKIYALDESDIQLVESAASP